MSSVTNIEGNDLDQLLTKLTNVTSKRDAFEIVGAYLSDSALGIHRLPFDYLTPFPPDDPGCVPMFTRSFVHADWHDGQDLVQAEQTASEDGFNLRFHRIEHDLDALSDDIATAFHCLGEMRAALASILGEIKAAIQVLQSDVAKLEGNVRGPGGFLTAPPPPVNQPKVLGSVNWFDKNMVAFETAQGVTLLPRVDTIDGSAGDPRLDRVSALATLVAEHRTKLRRGFAQGSATVAQLTTDFGKLTADGYTLADLLAILPADASFSSTDALVQQVAEREAAVIRTSGRADELIAASGGDGSGQPAATARLDNFGAIPTDVRTALIAAGVTTVGELASRKPTEVSTLLRQQGVAAKAPTVAGWIAGAQTFSLIR